MSDDTDLCEDCEYLDIGEEGFDPPRYGYCLSYGVELEWAGDAVLDFFRYHECMEDFYV